MKIVCIGRNYIDHAKELKNEVPSSPVIFIKPETALSKSLDFSIPSFTKDCQYELELVLRIGKSGKNIPKKEALSHVDAIALGIDFTARDLQRELKTRGLPWEKSKAFDHSAFISKFHKIQLTENSRFIIELCKNGKSVQKGDTSTVLFSFTELIVECSKYFTLQEGDLLYTGTPSGVGPILPNDTLTGFLNTKEDFNLTIR